jgi:hypothetical protein
MPSPTIFSYELQDAAGVKGSADVFVAYDAATETVGALLAAAAAIGGLIDAVTAGKVRGFTVRVPALPDPGWKSAAIANVDMEQTLLENFHITDSTYVQAIDIPCLRDTLIDPGGRPILTGPIAAFNAAVVAGTGITGITIQSKFLENLPSLADYAVTFRKRGRGRRAVSRVVVG